MGGAYVASAEDTEGSAVNSAAPAVRDPYSVDWFDYDLSVGLSFPGAFASTDFDNHGDFASLPTHARAGDFVEFNLGGTFHLGTLGFAATTDIQSFQLTTAAPNTPGLSLQLGRSKVLAATSLFGGQLAVGAGLRILTMQIVEDGGGPTLLTMTGVGPEAGALLMPTGRAWRIGATVRGPVSGGIFGSDQVGIDTGGVSRVGPFVLPTSVDMPWELEAGLAYQLGPRPLNPGWQNPNDQAGRLREQVALDREERALNRRARLDSASDAQRPALAEELAAEETRIQAIENQHVDEELALLRQTRKARYGNWPREKILLLASVLVTGPSANAVSLEGFLDQRAETVGRRASFTPRAGLEGEPLRDRLELRTGTYLEPSRYDGGAPRQHFTFGGDVRLLPFDVWGLWPADTVWKVAVYVDLAPRYANGGIALGTWH